MSIASEINRIQQNVTDSLTAVANKGVVVPAGSNSDDLPGLIAQIVSGQGSAITVTDTEDSHGGIVRTITAVSLAGDTVSPATLLAGYTAHNSLGEAITGTATGGGSAPRLQSKTNIAPTTSSQTIRPDTGYDGLSSVQINAMPSGTAGTPTATKGTVSNHSVTVMPSVTNSTGYITGGTKSGTAVTVTASELVSGSQTLTSNTTYDVTNLESVTVAVSGDAPTLQAKTGIAPTESSQTIEPDTGYDGLSSVQINAVSSTYVGSGITRRSSTDLTASGATVTVPAGYYSAQASKSVASGTATAPASISGTAATVSTGTNTLTLTKTVSVTPTVSTAGYISAGTAGNSSVSLTASVTTKAAATYNTSTTDQTISASQYLTGAQTIKAVTTSGISAANIKAGTTVTVGDANDADRIIGVTGAFTSDATATASDILAGETAYVNGSKVTGTLAFQTILTGSTSPSSSAGANGDIYLQTA